MRCDEMKEDMPLHRPSNKFAFPLLYTLLWVAGMQDGSIAPGHGGLGKC